MGKITLIGVFSNLICQRLAEKDGNIPIPLKIGALHCEIFWACQLQISATHRRLRPRQQIGRSASALVARIDRLSAPRKVTVNLNPKLNWGEDAQNESSVSAQEAKARVNARSDKPIGQPDLSLTELAISESDEPPQIKAAVSN